MNTSNESNVYSIEDILGITSTTINLVLGVPINGCVLWLVLTGAAGTMASEILTLNLCVFEILFSLLYLLYIITKMRPMYYLNGGLLFTGRPVFQSCICVERFMAVVHPVLFLKYKPLRYRAACSVLAWLLIVGASVAHMLLGGTKIRFYVYVGECLLYMSVMLSCSLAVLRALKQPVPGERERDNNMKRRSFTTICLIMVSFLLTYFTWCILGVIVFIVGLTDELALVSCMFMSITVITGLVQPLLHLCQKTGKLPCIKPIQEETGRVFFFRRLGTLWEEDWASFGE